ncbi:Uroporphyrinogen decarboxylase [Corynebacterium afermentans subsp. afermentans]|uniref:Uroporphyrinogen decarboxylase n=2 Tax=Corynebacterium TaxID=1716 RepID=A0A9X8WHM7_9CORY|nr:MULTISPECIES: uroporphyrinogen decarboxylase [Corynebacterium]RUQ13762.1 uroporphyrinogen decarboxylase [Corynebacterium genitalium]MDC7107879.1 uroporphyrinogen decarboxylase [Corynebacterium afermentans]OAA16840.1 uroporphyrinogen decarboxylase [Corynebacterium afermentans subsp. afermentans]WCZ33732.1 Uroporphyrinogen decarboxylase [Corynebacterium ihumii]WJY55882.1 Uroporphyrinogen decarboxylase [Corynebacterium afermentans subsp. afermentans]
MTRRDLTNAPLLEAACGRTPSRTPVWFMRQAGRSLPEYREVREGIPMLDSCFKPELLAEITLQPVRRHDVDAAILFSDIVVPLKAAGVDVEIVPGRGPVMAEAVRTRSDVEKLPVLDSEVAAVADGIRIILDELSDTQALIGFVGAPFTLASYLIEGGPSKNHEKTKAMMHAEPETWHALMRRLVPTIIAFLRTQVEAGIDAMQLFDSWAGFLTEADYREFVLPYSVEILESVAGEIPRIHFGVSTGELLGAMSEAGGEVMGVDWRVPLDTAATRFATPRVLQGNLDPAMLFAGTDVVRDEVARIKAEAARAIAAGDATGHIFNLGHGVLPTTDADAITEAVRIIHEES